MRAFRPNKKGVLALVMLAAAVGVGVAVATVTATVLADTHPAGGPPNEVRLRVVRSEFVPSADQPTFSSGWHTHPGPVIFQVQKGHFKITQTTCRPTDVGPGETYLETPGVPILATTKRPATWTTSLIVPADKPLASPAADPCQGGGDDDD
jgi:quercetin dioxygenase-like cupin family protein